MKLMTIGQLGGYLRSEEVLNTDFHYTQNPEKLNQLPCLMKEKLYWKSIEMLLPQAIMAIIKLSSAAFLQFGGEIRALMMQQMIIVQSLIMIIFSRLILMNWNEDLDIISIRCSQNKTAYQIPSGLHMKHSIFKVSRQLSQIYLAH
ncbi:hypothetical protein CEXT_517721 [Caerostris extrusa]|uniref:Uncharacterized protein n=1 Tax=Caerostris extrusa TaxID=172846 RepID=A0AAV4V773_CAEEX|nr:hypothetical protein CEXT_517721 [Caerostris extrusa]